MSKMNVALVSSLATISILFVTGSPLSSQTPAADEPVETSSLFGEPLRRIAIGPEQLAKLTGDLELAVAELRADPDDPHKLIWVGRRLGYLWRYNDAIGVFTRGVKSHPDLPHLYRHRGHRYLSVRKFDLAIADFERAANLIEDMEDEIEQDGAPNAAGIPTGTLHSNVWYHLGLAHYLKGDFESALAAQEKCLAVSKNDDMRVATLDWMYMTLRRLRRPAEAATLLESVQPKMNILENHAYHRRLLMYKGEMTPEDLIPDEKSDSYDLDLATYGYGVGNWYLINGDGEKAEETFQKVTAGKYWSAFGYIAAEADLFRMQDKH